MARRKHRPGQAKYGVTRPALLQNKSDLGLASPTAAQPAPCAAASERRPKAFCREVAADGRHGAARRAPAAPAAAACRSVNQPARAGGGGGGARRAGRGRGAAAGAVAGGRAHQGLGWERDAVLRATWRWRIH